LTADFGQGGYRVRFDWGPAGAAAIAPGAAVVAVVDVLSFTTALSVAVELGISVLPFPWADAAAAAAAEEHGAVLAVGRSQAGRGQISLSPPSLRQASPPARLVLPSPNGSAISSGLAATGVTVVGVSLRNFPAAAGWVHRAAAGRPVAVLAAGERWPDGSLRPAVEDLWGAGAFLDAFTALDAPRAGSRTGDDLSPEAGAARAAYRSVASGLGSLLRSCAGGRELAELGFGADVAVAAEVAASDAVPVLRDGWFINGRSGPQGRPG
jgi:2-phosphosulfolactate phosphatase